MRRTPGLLLLAAALALALAAPAAEAQRDQAITLRSVTPLAWADAEGNRNPTLTVEPGAVVTFTIVNDDGGYHNFQAGSQEPSAYLENKGDQLTYAFTAPASGSVEYKCPVHPVEMKGTLRVAGAGAEPTGNGTPGPAFVGLLLAVAGSALLLARRN